MPFTKHPVFLSPPDGQCLWRFMDFPRFFYLMSRRKLYFSSLATLTNDPWEGLPPRKYFDPGRMVEVGTAVIGGMGALDLAKASNFEIMPQSQFFGGIERFSAHISNAVKGYEDLKRKIFVSCWHMNDAESEALWRIYGGLGYGICIRTTYQRLGMALAADRPIYAGKVTYLDETRDMLGDDNIFYNCLWKRKSFEHEREFRILLQDSTVESPGLSLPVDITQLIEEVIVQPEAAEWFLGIIKDFVGSCGCVANVGRSSLLAPPEYR